MWSREERGKCGGVGQLGKLAYLEPSFGVEGESIGKVGFIVMETVETYADRRVTRNDVIVDENAFFGHGPPWSTVDRWGDA